MLPPRQPTYTWHVLAGHYVGDLEQNHRMSRTYFQGSGGDKRVATAIAHLDELRARLVALQPSETETQEKELTS